jgi:hypothetical protein
LSSLTSSFDHGLRCAVVFFAGTNNLLRAVWETRRTVSASPAQRGCTREPRLRGRGEYIVLAAWPESGRQFRLLRGKLRLGQNAPGLQFRHPLYCSEDVLLPASRSAGRALLLRGGREGSFRSSRQPLAPGQTRGRPASPDKNRSKSGKTSIQRSRRITGFARYARTFERTRPGDGLRLNYPLANLWLAQEKRRLELLGSGDKVVGMRSSLGTAFASWPWPPA